MFKASRFLLFTLLTLVATALSAQAERIAVLPAQNIGYDVPRLALVVGNSQYNSIPDLENTLNDAGAMARSLQSVGFRVIHAENVTRRGMNDAIDQFLAAISPGSEALIYYAGHGVELEGENYLLPTDIRSLKPSQQRRLREESIGLNRLLGDLRARQARVNLVLLDACRDNPFPRENTRSLGSTAGLGRIDPPNGTVVVYAAAAGEKALDKLSDDDPNPNGLFTRHLLDLIDQPGLEIRPLVQELKERVYKDARATSLRNQRPSYYDGLIGKFYFRPQAEALALKHPCEVLVDPRATLENVMVSDYNASVPLCRNAIVMYPDNPLYRTLLDRAEEQWAAQKAMRSGDIAASNEYLQHYGNGFYLKDVMLHLAEIDPGGQPVQVQAPAVEVAARGSARAATTEPEQAPRATLAPPPSSPQAALAPQVSLGPILSEEEIHLEIQMQLNRLGCSAGRPDGKWGRLSAAGLRNFARHSDARLASLDPDMDVLDLLRKEQGRVCPLSCSKTETLENGRCVAKTCASGQRLSSAGNCYTPKKRNANVCASGQRRNSKGVCYTPRKQAAKSTTRGKRRVTRKATAAPAQKKWDKPKTRKRRPRGVSGYNYQCEGAGPGLC